MGEVQVLQQKIKGDAAQPRGGKQQLPSQAPGPQHPRPHHQQGQVAQEKSAE